MFSVLAAWHAQFKDEPSMATVANLYKQLKPDVSRRSARDEELAAAALIDPYAAERSKQQEKEEAKRKAKAEKEAAKEKARKEQEEAMRREKDRRNRKKRPPFDFEKVRQIFSAKSVPTSSLVASNSRKSRRLSVLLQVPLKHQVISSMR